MFNNDEIKQLESLVKNVVSTELEPVKEDLSTLKTFAKKTEKKLKQIHHDQNVIIKTFDERDLERQKEIKQIREYIHLPKAS